MANQESDANDPLLDIHIDMNEFGVSIESLKSTNDKSIEQESISEPEADEAEPPPFIGPLDEIKLQLNSLSKAFETKLKYDDHKNKIIDELHQSLQEYRQGLVQKYVQKIFTDVLKVVDDIRKFSAHYSSNRNADDTMDKFLTFLESTASDLEDLFLWEGISPFSCEGNLLDPARQRILNKFPTDDPAKDKIIAERVRPGYEYNGKIVRPEMVSVFVYQNNVSAEDMKTNGQASSS
ncbi:MAG: nucleotide exchange factor GrpE [Desulfobacterales bacterium]|jgi:molecular chaperone GrpE (heat shock protein)|nr:nucleotide exchange factor GrpE [Desulfobacterales bacterium]